MIYFAKQWGMQMYPYITEFLRPHTIQTDVWENYFYGYPKQLFESSLLHMSIAFLSIAFFWSM